MKPPRAIRTPTLEPVEKYTECCRPWTARPRCRWVNLETNRGARRPKPDHTRRRAKARRLTPPHLLFHAALPLRLSALQLAVRFVMPSATLAVATTATSDAQDLQRFQLGLSNSCLSNSCLSNSALPWSGAALGSSRRCATATRPRTCAHCAPSNRHTGTWWARHAEGSSGGGPTVQDPGAVAAAAAAAAALAAACQRGASVDQVSGWMLLRAASGPEMPRGGFRRLGPGLAAIHAHAHASANSAISDVCGPPSYLYLPAQIKKDYTRTTDHAHTRTHPTEARRARAERTVAWQSLSLVSVSRSSRSGRRSPVERAPSGLRLPPTASNVAPTHTHTLGIPMRRSATARVFC